MSFQAIKLLSPPVINIRGDSFLSVAWKERFFPSRFFATQRTWPRLKILANILLSLANNKDGLVLDNTTTILFFSFGNKRLINYVHAFVVHAWFSKGCKEGVLGVCLLHQPITCQNEKIRDARAQASVKNRAWWQCDAGG